MIPLSPTRKRTAELLESLAKSRRTSKALAEKALIVSSEEASDNQVNKKIVNSVKNISKMLNSNSSGTMKESIRSAYSSGLKMAALGCTVNMSIRKISKKLEVRPSLVSGVFLNHLKLHLIPLNTRITKRC